MADMVRVPKGPTRSYTAPEARIPRSQFNLSRTYKTTFDVGKLYPVYLEEILPGDTFTVNTTALVRLFQPLDAPILSDIEMDLHFFYVPNRILWENWHRFLGDNPDSAGAQTTDYTIPVIADGYTIGQGTLASYFGVPVGLSTTAEDVNALPFRAYAACYNEWYRDENLIDPIAWPTDDGPDASTFAASGAIRKSAKKHDYFTSALPFLQKGDEQSLPLAGQARVETDLGATGQPTVYSNNANDYVKLDVDATWLDVSASTGTSGQRLFVDLASVVNSGISINALRESIAIQRMLERDARGGTRPNEILRAHFGVDVPDYRVDRPEYLGGGKGFIQVNPVPNTSGVDSTVSISGNDEPQGELRAYGVGTLRASYAKSFVEHGYVIGILRARGEITYQQGLDRLWSRSSKLDFYWPDLATLGEQPILNKELYIVGDATDDDVFGYQERYAEYRFGKSLITGELQSDAVGSIDFWHLAEDFGSQPALNQTFIEDQTPLDRVIVDTTGHHFLCDIAHNVKAARPIPVMAVPSISGMRF